MRTGARFVTENFDRPYRLLSRDVPAWLGSALDSFVTWQRFFGRGREPGDRELALFVAIVREAAAVSRRQFPGSRFQVMFWDARKDARIAVIEAQLREAGIPVYRVTDAIPDLMTNLLDYVISEHDWHPNPLQHQRIADYVLRHVLTARAQ
jgi:hypothetical protein